CRDGDAGNDSAGAIHRATGNCRERRLGVHRAGKANEQRRHSQKSTCTLSRHGSPHEPETKPICRKILSLILCTVPLVPSIQPDNPGSAASRASAVGKPLRVVMLEEVYQNPATHCSLGHALPCMRLP